MGSVSGRPSTRAEASRRSPIPSTPPTFAVRRYEQTAHDRRHEELRPRSPVGAQVDAEQVEELAAFSGAEKRASPRDRLARTEVRREAARRRPVGSRSLSPTREPEPSHSADRETQKRDNRERGAARNRGIERMISDRLERSEKPERRETTTRRPGRNRGEVSMDRSSLPPRRSEVGELKGHLQPGHDALEARASEQRR